MDWYRETLLLGEAVRLEVRVERDGSYRLSLAGSGGALVEYWSEGGRHQRRVQGRMHAYEFRSVEQLRYEFERDVENALRAR